MTRTGAEPEGPGSPDTGIVGGLGLAPSADVSRTHGVFQPSHGSAPNIAGKGVANLIAAILFAVMMLEWLGGRHADRRCNEVAGIIQAAVEAVLAEGPSTRVLSGKAGTGEVTQAIIAAVASHGDAVEA